MGEWTNTSAPNPSGAQYEIGYGGQRATVTEVGGALRDYRVDGLALLDGYPPGEMCTGARGQSLIPWPNRIAGGAYTFAGTDYQLALTDPDTGGSIHGLVRWANWTCAEHTDSRVVMRHLLHAQQGWPFLLGCELEYNLDDDGLTVRTTAINLGDRPCPYGTGAHPYLSVGTPVVDPALLRIPAETYFPTDRRMIPTGRAPVGGTPYDFRSPRRVGDTRIDRAFTDLLRDDDGRARVRLTAPDGPTVALWLSDSYPYVEIFTGDTLPERDRHRTGLGVEPMTCAPNAFRSGDGLLVLAPGRAHSAWWGIEPPAG